MEHHVATVPRDLPWCVKEALLTSIETTLDLAGATRVWVVPGEGGALLVLADLPVERQIRATG
jgi:hypothetical protein